MVQAIYEIKVFFVSCDLLSSLEHAREVSFARCPIIWLCPPLALNRVYRTFWLGHISTEARKA